MGELAWPFRGAEALAAGAVCERELRRFYSSVYPGVYAPRGVQLSAVERGRAAWLWSRRRGVIAGLSAAAMLGAKWIESDLPAELIHSNPRMPPLLTVYNDKIGQGETRLINGMPVTTPARVAFDIGRRTTLTVGVQRIDALMNATELKVVDMESVIENHPGVRGLAPLRRTLALVDGGAESPNESLTRLTLVQDGFPAPEAQTSARRVSDGVRPH